MGFGDRPPYDDGARSVTMRDIVRAERARKTKGDKHGGDVFELDTMKAFAKTLDTLPGGSVRRVLSRLAERYGFALVNVDEVAPEPPLGLTRDTQPMPPLEHNPVQVVPWVPPNMGTVVCNSMPVWTGE